MIKNLRLQNFRSYGDYTTELTSGVNIVVGPNASGKTNLLEAIYVVNMGKSFRVSDKDLIAHGKEWARIDAVTGSDNRIWRLEDKQNKYEKSLEIDGKPHKRITNKITRATTLFEPNHLRLLNGSPETRRSYLDQILSQSDYKYSQAANKYTRALRQRNVLLKNRQNTQDDLFVWDVKLSEYGGYLNTERNKLIKHINKTVSEDYSEVAGAKTKIKLEYSNSVSGKDYTSALLKELQSKAEEHSLKGFTTIGPHREDFKVFINGEDSSTTASRGEARTLVVVLKLIELKLLEAERHEKPLLLLDDVFSELDGKRRKSLTEHIAGYQTMITTTDAEAVIEHFNTGEYKIIPTSINYLSPV